MTSRWHGELRKKLHEHGAEMAFSYQGEALEKRVRPLAASLGSDFLLECDVSNMEALDGAFDHACKARWPTIDFVVHAIGFSDKNELRGRLCRYQPRKLPDDDEHLGLQPCRRGEAGAWR